MPPAWSSLPEMGLNFTWTKPSFTLVSFLRQTGYVASPDCFSTSGLLGALSSFSMVHFASPLPVLVAVQPGGASPALASSKLMVSASAVPAMTDAERVAPMNAVQCGLDRFGQLLCLASTPIMEEKDARVLVRHVAMNRHDVDPFMAKGFQHRLQFIFKHSKV